MTDYSNIGAICFDCAQKAGFVQKDKIVGVWLGECDICHKQKPCTDLHHDWKPTKGSEMNTISQPYRGARSIAETTEAKDPTHSAVRKG